MFYLDQVTRATPFEQRFQVKGDRFLMRTSLLPLERHPTKSSDCQVRPVIPRVVSARTDFRSAFEGTQIAAETFRARVVTPTYGRLVTGLLRRYHVAPITTAVRTTIPMKTIVTAMRPLCLS